MSDVNKKNLKNDDELRKTKTDDALEKVENLSDDDMDMASGGGCGCGGAAVAYLKQKGKTVGCIP